MVNPTALSEVLTLGQIAVRLETSTHKVKYAVERYRIRPIGRVGILRVWSAASLPAVRNALEEIAAKRRKTVEPGGSGGSSDSGDTDL